MTWSRPFFGKSPDKPAPRPKSSLRARKGDKVLPAVHANVGIEIEFRRRLYAFIDEMRDDYCREIERAWRHHEPVMTMATDGQRRAWVIERSVLSSAGDFRATAVHGPNANGREVVTIALDATPAADIAKIINALSKRWQSKVDDIAPQLAKWFAKESSKRSQAALRRILRNGGMTVEFKMTKAMKDVMAATIDEQVGLIKSIPQQYHTQVQGMVMRSVTAGRDLGELSKELYKRYDITKARAALIARDQNNKATASMTRVRQLDLGITEAIWLHSTAGKQPRPTHVKNSGKRYDVAKGWWDPAVKKFIFPGELINCRCVSRSVIKGFT